MWGLSAYPKRTGKNLDNLFSILFPISLWGSRTEQRRGTGADHVQGQPESLCKGCSHMGIPPPRSPAYNMEAIPTLQGPGSSRAWVPPGTRASCQMRGLSAICPCPPQGSPFRNRRLHAGWTTLGSLLRQRAHSCAPVPWARSSTVTQPPAPVVGSGQVVYPEEGG